MATEIQITDVIKAAELETLVKGVANAVRGENEESIATVIERDGTDVRIKTGGRQDIVMSLAPAQGTEHSLIECPDDEL